VPDALTESSSFAASIVALLGRLQADVLIPISEPSLLTLLPLRAALSGVLLPFPEDATFRSMCDKQAVLSRAAALGIQVPSQVTLTDPAFPPPDPIEFPLALKPARSVVERDGRRLRVGVGYAASERELRERLSSFDPAAFPVLAQQRINGPGIGVFLLRWRGVILAAFAHRRIREKPPSGGVSVYRESTTLPAGLLQASCDLLESFDWSGVAMIEYKLDAGTGTPYLMEVNGRFWGSLQLAIDAGVDFPVLLLNAAVGTPAPPVLSWRLGIRSRWWWGDVDQLLTRLRHSAAHLNLPPGTPGRLGALAQFFMLWRPGDHNEVLKLDDPAPFFRETADWFRRN
jgi:predicted ATP-grasp superfamily ATP-dependent carboligase